jgi:trimeric autotransporter adhesin
MPRREIGPTVEGTWMTNALIGAPRRRRVSQHTLAGVATLALLAGSALAQDQKVGVTATAHAPATGTPPQAATRELRIGLDMVRNERIVTGAEGKTQLLFVDGSALTIGPNAELILDEFVYDPVTETGKLAMTATKGVFRVVGGKISKSDAITLKTPTATLGIRGGIAMANVGGAQGTGFFSFLFGKQMTVDGTGADGQPTQQVVTRPGTGVPLGPGGTLGAPVPIPPGVLANQLGSLEGNSGQTGGAPERPTDPRVASTDLAALGSGLPPEVTGTEPAAGGPGVTPPPLPTPPETRQASQTQTQNDAASSSSSSSSPGDASPPGTIVIGSLAGRYKSTPGSGSAAGTAGDGTTSFDRAFTGASIDGNNVFFATPGGNSFSAPVNPNGGFLSYSNADSPFGPITGQSFITSARDFMFFESTETNFSDERSFLFAGIGTPATAIPTTGFAAYSIRNDFIGGTTIPFMAGANGGNLGGLVSPAFLTFQPSARRLLQASVAIVGSGASQSSVVSVIIGGLGDSGPLVLDGQMRGSFRSSGFPQNPMNFAGPAGFATDGLGNTTFGALGPDYFVFESNNGSTRGITGNGGALSPYFPNNVGSRIALPADVGTSRTSGVFTGFINGVSQSFPFNNSFNFPQVLIGSFNDTNGFNLVTLPVGNAVSISTNMFDSGFNVYSLSFGGVGNQSAFIDDQRFGARETIGSSFSSEGPGGPLNDVRSYAISSAFVDISGLMPPGHSVCECAFMRWGVWSADIVNPYNETFQRVHLGQWVAGTLASAIDIPTSGTASYQGHAIADIINSGAIYKAAGGFTFSYGFDSQIGTATIHNLDGRTYSGNLSGSGAANLPTGTISGGLGISGPMTVGFFRNGGNPIAGVGGQFKVSDGETYSANGIVVGQQVPQ